MKRLAMAVLLAAIGVVAAVSNVTTGELQSKVATIAQPVSVREMKSADWDGNAMETLLANTSLDTLLEVFNPQHLARRWTYQHVNLTDECWAHMNQYLTQLEKGVLWAFKSE